MAGKQFEIAGVGTVTILKRATNRSIRLSIRSDGQIMITMPRWASYKSALAFAESKRDWLADNVRQPHILEDGQTIGKLHTLALLPTVGLKVPRTLVSTSKITVRYPRHLKSSDPLVQTAASTACLRALRNQANELLPPRLQQLADQHGFSYNTVSVKRLKGRWGSCDSNQNIVFNLFLMQLPWECIDYVILHELTHTKIMRHGPPFWDYMARLVPNLTSIRRQMRQYQPVLQSAD